MKRALLIFALLGTASAVDVPGVRPLGFSADGRTYAFESSWNADGSGFPFRELHVINVLENSYAERVRLGGQAYEEREAALDAEYAARKARILARYGVSGSRAGASAYAASLPTPLTSSFSSGPARISLIFKGRPLNVRLDETRVPNSCAFSDALPDGEVPVGLSLVVNGRTLQRDAVLPTTRQCAYRYFVEDVRVWNDRVAVLLRAFTPGFEGPDAFPLVVTGRWR